MNDTPYMPDPNEEKETSASADDVLSAPIGANTASDGSYHLTKDQIDKDTNAIPGVAEFSGLGNETSAPQYEVSYDSSTGEYSYSDPDSATAAPPAPKKKKGKAGLIVLFSLCGTLVLLILCAIMLLLGGWLSNLTGAPTAGNNLNAPVVTQTVVNVNDAGVTETNLMKAAASAVPSVVVIDTFANQAAVDAGEHSGSGSGVIWTADGYIVTCNHVVEGYSLIRVTLADGTYQFAELVGTDVRTDLAVLKINGANLSAVTVRGTELVLAEPVIAIGNPLGVLSNTVSEGILSCLTRTIVVGGQPMSLIQTDAAVNHGNSGGGLFDSNGSLIGIVNAKSTGDSVEGIGFAIPITTVLDVCNQLIEVGYVAGRPQLGVTVVTVNQSNASVIFEEGYYPKLKDYATSTYKDIWGREHTQIIPGVYVYDTSKVAGYVKGSETLEFGDRVLYVGNTEVSETADVLSALATYNAGDTIQMTVQRDHQTTIVVNIILGQKGAN